MRNIGRILFYERHRLAFLFFAAAFAVFILCRCQNKNEITHDDTQRVALCVIQFEDKGVFDGTVIPVMGKISSSFGIRDDPFTDEKTFHKGIDIAVDEGTPVAAFEDGTAEYTGYSDIGGNYIILDHGGGYRTYYGHLSRISVSPGDSIKAGQIIATSGATGKVTGPHLHFQITKDGEPIDPEEYLEGLSE